MSNGQAPSDLFRKHLAAEVSARIVDDDAHIEGILRELVQAARAAWPSLPLVEDTFVAYLAARLPSAATSVDALRELHVGDLYLACACGRGDAAAIAAFDAAYLADIGRVVPRRAGTTEAEVTQAVREKLLVGREGGGPKIADYSGRGDLGSWVRVVAVRTALNLGRGKNREVPLDDDILADRAAGPHDAEMHHLKTLYRGEFAEAFRHALARLDVRDRNMLRQHYVDGLAMEQIGAMYNVHRITVVRRMKEARKELAAETRRRLKAKLRVSRGELESIMRLIQSQLDVSLRLYLRDDADGPSDP